jgi:hypothetical protein
MEMDMNTTTNNTTMTDAAEILRGLDAKALCQYVRHLSDRCDMYARWRDTSARAVDSAQNFYLAIEEQKRRYAKLPAVTYATVFVETSFKYVTMHDAVWEAYDSGRYADGRNGVLSGINAATGKVERFEWAHLSKLWPGYDRDDGTTVPPCFHLATCG